MADKIWAHLTGGVVDAVTSLPGDLVPGEDVFTADVAANMVDVTVAEPQPAPGWTTTNGGKTFSAPAAPAAVVPANISSAQAKIQLLRTPGSADGKTLLDDVTSAVQSAGGEVAIWFSDARTWERSNPYVAQLGKSLKLKAADIDALFAAAEKIAA